jgi:hypothetical protein
MKAGTVAISFRGLSCVPNRNAFHGNELIYCCVSLILLDTFTSVDESKRAWWIFECMA